MNAVRKPDMSQYLGKELGLQKIYSTNDMYKYIQPKKSTPSYFIYIYKYKVQNDQKVFVILFWFTIFLFFSISHSLHFGTFLSFIWFLYFYICI